MVRLCKSTSLKTHNDGLLSMHDEQDNNNFSKSRRVALTARFSLQAYDAITEIQRLYRRRTGRHKCLWEVLDAAVIAYAKQQGIDIKE